MVLKGGFKILDLFIGVQKLAPILTVICNKKYSRRNIVGLTK